MRENYRKTKQQIITKSFTGEFKKKGGMPEFGGLWRDIWGIFGGHLEDFWRKIVGNLEDARGKLEGKHLVFKILIFLLPSFWIRNTQNLTRA